jgi:hypothetical protein
MLGADLRKMTSTVLFELGVLLALMHQALKVIMFVLWTSLLKFINLSIKYLLKYCTWTCMYGFFLP